jgi:nucleoside 2-deoxyribosyltransferase
MEKSSSGQGRRMICYLTGQESTKRILAEVRDQLTSLDVVVWTADEILIGSSISKAIEDALTSADFVCAVIPATEPSSAVMFEAGLATGLQRPLLVVADEKGADTLPALLLSAPMIRYKPGMAKVLRENLNAYVKQVQPVASQHVASKETLLDFSTTNLNRHVGEMHLQNLLANRFQEAGALVAVDSRIAAGLRPDLVVTFPELGPEFSPIIVEIKSRRQRSMRYITEHVRRYLDAAGARLGLIVDESNEQETFSRIYDSTGILYVSAKDLQAWNNDQLLDELTRLRNKVVHSA